MRCPNAACRQVFVVQDADQVESKSGRYTELYPEAVPLQEESPEPDAATSKQSKPHQGGAVGEFVTILEAEVVNEVPASSARPKPVPKGVASAKDAVPTLPAEVVDELKPATTQQDATWRQPPPVRDPEVGTGARQPSPTPSPLEPSEQLPSWHNPPPIRRGGAEGAPDITVPDDGGHVDVFEADTPLAEVEGNLAPPTPVKAARRSLLIAFILLVAAAGVLGVIVVSLLNKLTKKEEQLVFVARQDYVDGKYADAANAFENLIKEFPKSDHLPRFRLYADLSQIRDQAYSAQGDPPATLTRLNRFVDENKNNPLLKEFHADLCKTFQTLVEKLTNLARSNHDVRAFTQAKDAFAQSQAFRVGKGNLDEETRLKDLIADAQGIIALAQKRQQALDQIGRLLAEDRPTIDTVRKARDIAEQEGLKDDLEARRLIEQLGNNVRTWVRYVSRRTAPTSATAEPFEPSLIVSPETGGFTNRPQESKRIMLALVRGVLYGMDQGTGEARWVTRVGIDTTALPIRLPASPTSPELFLVLSAARNTVMTLDAQTGQVKWQHQLAAPCLGRPVVVGPWAYVPTYDGRVYEIETVQGYVQGYFELGQPLTVGGVWQEGTDLLYIPGDSDNLYVLDTALSAAATNPARKKECVMILHTGHPSGSLRSEPIIVTRPDPFAKTREAQTSWPPYLILSQTDGLNHMKLRVFGLPIESPDARPLLQPEPRVSGWSWFQPYHDGEKLAFVTDVGVFGLFGINQVRNEDRPIFPAFSEEQKPPENAVPLGRAQVVYAVENDFWVLANGELQRLHFDLFGQRMIPLWTASLPLGSPLHAGQMDDSGKTLYVVTQDLKRQSYLATAVDAERGKIIWQRQLGLDCRGDPVVLAGQVVLLDRGSGLFAFPKKRDRLEPGQDTWWRTQPYRPEGAIFGTPYLFVADNGAAVYEVSAPEKGTQLTVRVYRVAGQPETMLIMEKEQKVDLPAPLQGAPALGPQGMLLLLADSTVQRLTLPLDGSAGAGGPNWRSESADDGARGFIAQVSAGEFLTTNGSRGLTHWQWPANRTFSTIPENRVPTVELPARIVAAPLVLPKVDPNAALRVIVADADNNLSLLQGPELKTECVWKLGGEITAGPFLRGQRIGCIVERRNFVWIDPAREKILWRYTMAGEGIVGEPQVIGDSLVLADLSGRFIALDPETGRPRGSAYLLKANAAPVATPVAYGQNGAFVALTDGTVLILPLRNLRNPVVTIPTLP